MRSVDMTEWLDQERIDRGWSLRELGRRAGVSHAQVSHVLSGSSLPGWDFCVGVARALGLAPELVLRRAGLLPPIPERGAEEEELLGLFGDQPAPVRRTLLSMLRGLAHRSAPLDPDTEELLQIYRGLPDEWRAEFRQAARTWALNAHAGHPRVIGEDPPDDDVAT